MQDLDFKLSKKENVYRQGSINIFSTHISKRCSCYRDEKRCIKYKG